MPKKPDKPGFTPSYIFDRGRLRSIIVGSSNLTQTALTVNQEWNARLVSAAEGEFARQIQTEFDALWEHPASHALEDVLDDYRIGYEQTKTVRRAFFSQEPTLAGELAHQEIRPNAMQKRLADNLLTLMRKEEPGADITVPKKGLLISATGTGKTYASAFASKPFSPNELFFSYIANRLPASHLRVTATSWASPTHTAFSSGNSRNRSGHCLCNHANHGQAPQRRHVCPDRIRCDRD